MKATQEMNCSTCKFSDTDSVSKYQDGKCLRFPPDNTNLKFPLVNNITVCGEWVAAPVESVTKPAKKAKKK